MGCLLDDLSAGLVLLPPPLRRRRGIEPVTGQQLRGVVFKQRPRLVNGVKIAPVVADRCDDALCRHCCRNRLCRLKVERHRFFDEEGNPARDQVMLGFAVRKGGTQT